MKNTLKIALPVLVLVIVPLVASAQFGGIKGLITGLGDIIQTLTGIAAAAALLFFLWGLAKFILALGGDEKAVAQGRTFMIWGLIALFVMVTVWGIIAFMQRELGIGGGGGVFGGTYPAPTNVFDGFGSGSEDEDI